MYHFNFECATPRFAREAICVKYGMAVTLSCG